MSNHATPTKASRSSRSTSKLSTKPELYQAGYQQALHDFAILPLLHRLQSYSNANFDAAWVALTPQEAEAIAVLLIQTLITNLDGKLLAAYLSAIRGKTSYASPSLATLHLPPPPTDLPDTFPDVEMPRFLYGDRLCWLSNGETTDWGIAIGRFYSFAPHCCRWCWCYLIWLDPDSPSSAWVAADIAWEEDLQPLEAEAAR
ncbi:hypothetical protein [Leptolyngbya sp. FACHB-671]|uniref:hypothetical protein n=1 Tax=Leptolyngbya sp. FACHB-671 TaxID=2692812 RepID=UPI001F55A6D2|nr:hypothetical protein [Leptolyngbya sp. FACHB-671]